MLPKETKTVAYLSEESAFFTNQCWKEARRVIMMDYAMAREHFVDCGEQMHRHIYEINLGWGQFLDYYTDLNNARQEKDDSYAEQHYIGEEIIEPDDADKSPYVRDRSLKEEEQQPQWEEAVEEDADNALAKTEEESASTGLLGQKVVVKKAATVVHE